MPIDWSKVMESLVLIVPTAGVGGYIGTRIKSYLDRAKPYVTITTCRKGRATDLIGSKVTVPTQLSEMLRSSKWCETLSGEINAAKIFHVFESLQERGLEARHAIAFIDQKLLELPALGNADRDRKLAFLDDITRREVGIIDAVYTGAICREEFLLPSVSDTDLAALPKVAEYESNTDSKDGGFKINLRNKFYLLNHKSRLDKRLEPLAKAFCHFHIPTLEMILSNAKKELASLVVDSAGLMDALKGFIADATPLIVEVSIVNRGSSAVTFSSWGACRLLNDKNSPPLDIPLARTSAYWKPQDPVQAAQQQKTLIESDAVDLDESRFFTVDGGRGGEMKYRSVESLASLEKKFPHLTTLLATDVFRCQVMLKRADIAETQDAWVASRIGRFGAESEVFPQSDLADLHQLWSK